MSRVLIGDGENAIGVVVELEDLIWQQTAAKEIEIAQIDVGCAADAAIVKRDLEINRRVPDLRERATDKVIVVNALALRPDRDMIFRYCGAIPAARNVVPDAS